jgi:hypothetical protein
MASHPLSRLLPGPSVNNSKWYQYKVSKSKSNWFGDLHSAVNTVEPLECLEHAVIHGMWGPEYELEDKNN